MIVQRLPDRERIWDTCIVGSGPVGLSLAFELESLGVSVALIEAGPASTDSGETHGVAAELINPETHAAMEIATCRALGGTSWLWGGRCVPFDDIDFEPRQYVPYSGWPITHDEIRPWYNKAAEYLLCGPAIFQSPSHHLSPPVDGVTCTALERWAVDPRILLHHRKRLETSTDIVALTGSTVVDIPFSEENAVDGVVAVNAGGRVHVRARHVVLACGGVETARLLLAVQRRTPKRFGGDDGPLGRFYMGHIAGKVADIVFDDPATIQDFDYALDAGGQFVRRRFTFTGQAQRDAEIMNIAFWPDNPPFHDPAHQNTVLSAIFLALAFPPTGRRLLSEGTRLYHVGKGPHDYLRHLWNIASGLPTQFPAFLRLLGDRTGSGPRKPSPLVTSPTGRYALAYHGEQEPNPNSRITLGEELGTDGIPKAVIDLRFTDWDVRSVIKAHQLLDTALRKSRTGHLEFRIPEADLMTAIGEQATDGFHQAGTARMGVNRTTSVVNKDLATHDAANLHIASSAVFPTTGQANSTFLAVALAVKLAHHIQHLSRITPSITTISQTQHRS